MRALFVSSLLLVLTACPKKKEEPAPAPAPVREAEKKAITAAATQDAFWKWFQANEARLAETAAKDPVAVMTEVQSELERSAERGVIVEIAVEPDGQKPHTLVVSADGHKPLFPAVRKVAEAAPPLKRWKVRAFRPRRPEGMDMEIGGTSYGVADFTWREVGRNQGLLDVEIAVKGLTPANKEQLGQAGFLMLDAMVGELDTETKIGGIEFVAPEKKPSAEWKPLSQLPTALDAM